MGETKRDTADDLLESLAGAVAQAASSPRVEPMHRAEARAALAAIEAADFAIVPRPEASVCSTLGDALSRPRTSEPGSSAADATGDIRAARQWLDRLAAVLDRMPEG